MFSNSSSVNKYVPMNDNIAIRANGLSKCYRIYNHPRDRLIQAIWGRDRFARPKLRYREFWALNDVSFELARGQTLGVVGRNGSGKSTLLQLLCGTLLPTNGNVETKGRIGALLELGSGFNPEFSGLDNVYLNASLLGLSQTEIENQLDAILSFADIGDFVDQPVKTYSSGMAVRLAFAVQAHISPDLLVVDEALAVGDELFQKKCYAHLNQLKEQGTAVLLVTHSCPQIIQHCDQALLLHRGRMRMLNTPAKVTTTYQRLINESDKSWDEYFEEYQSKDRKIDCTSQSEQNLEQSNRKAWMDEKLIPKTTDIYQSKGGKIIDVWVTLKKGSTSKNDQVNHFEFGIDFSIHFEYKAQTALQNVAMACNLSGYDGQRISGQCHPKDAGLRLENQYTTIEEQSHWRTEFRFRGGLWPGIYFISGGLLSYQDGERSFIHRVIDIKAIRILDTDLMHRIGACSLGTEDAKVVYLTGREPN